MSYKWGDDAAPGMGQPNDNLLDTLKVIAEESAATRGTIQKLRSVLTSKRFAKRWNWPTSTRKGSYDDHLSPRSPK